MLFLVAAFAMIPLMNKRREEAAAAAAQEQPPPAQTQEVISEGTPSEPPVASEAIEQVTTVAEEIVENAEETVAALEELSYLKNDLMEVIFTNQGGFALGAMQSSPKVIVFWQHYQRTPQDHKQ